MNIKLRTLFYTFLSLFICRCCLAQDKSATWPPKKFPHDPKNCFHLLSNSYQCRWIYWGIKGNLAATVIAFDTVAAVKKGPAAAAVIIVKTEKDTVRVLLLSPKPCRPGDHITIVQAKEPELDVLVPFDRDFFISEENNGNKPQCRINEYDSRVFRTAWGAIIQKPLTTVSRPANAHTPEKKKGG